MLAGKSTKLPQMLHEAGEDRGSEIIFGADVKTLWQVKYGH